MVSYAGRRKILVVDGKIGFTGGINIGELWAPPDAPELGWRDDDVEIRGPAAGDMRAAFYDVWKQCGGAVPAGVRPMSIVATHDSHVRVLTNRIEGRKNRVIHRTYLFGLRHATTSVDIASAYFLPGPRFLRALRSAAGRGVRVRILIPEHSDQRIVALATSSLYGRLLASGVEVFMYLPRVLHTKTAIFDGRYTMIGSHNLDAVSAQYNLECNVVVDSAEFGAISRASFERDLADSTRLELDTWKRRPVPLRFVAWFAALFRAFM